MTLRFQVQGSGKLPYRIVIEGEGSDLRAFCSCPAGRLGGTFCKHAAALFMGDVTKLVQPSDDVEELKRRAKGSMLVGKALAHQPSEKNLRGNTSVAGKTVRDIAEMIAPRLAAKGLLGKYEETESGDQILMIREIGDRRRSGHNALLCLSFETEYDVTDVDGEVLESRTRVRPWSVRTGKKVRAWASLERAYPVFLEMLEEIEEK